MTGDHFIKKGGGDFDEADDPNFLADSVAVVLFDRATRWLAVYPKSTKTTYHTIEAFQHFAGAKDKIRSFHCDNAPELLSAARALHWRLSTATPGMPQTNGVAENCVRRTKEGGGCAIVQSGLNPRTILARSWRTLLFLDKHRHHQRRLQLQQKTHKGSL